MCVKPSGIFIRYLMFSSRKYEKVGLLIVELVADVATLSGTLDGSKRFKILSVTNDLKLVSEYQEEHLYLFQII